MIFGIIGIFCLNYIWDLAKLYYYKKYNEGTNYFSDLGYIKQENKISRIIMMSGGIITTIFFLLEIIFNTQSDLIKTFIICLGISLSMIGIFSYDKHHKFYSLLHGLGFVNTLIFVIIIYMYFVPLISFILLILTFINFIIVIINRLLKLSQEKFRKIECPYQKILIFIFMLCGLYLFYIIR